MQILDVFFTLPGIFLCPSGASSKTTPGLIFLKKWQIYCCDYKEWENLSASLSYKCEGLIGILMEQDKITLLLKPAGEGVCGQKMLILSKSPLNYAHSSYCYFKGQPWQPTDCSVGAIHGLCKCHHLNWLPGFSG